MAGKVRCLICNSPAVRLYVDGLLEKGLSNAGIAAGVVEMGGKLDPDVIGRHKNNHWVRPVPAEGPKPTRGDLAILVRDKAYDLIENMSPDTMAIMSKEVMPVVGKGLQSQAILDKRDVNQKRLGIAAGALSLQAWLAGLGAATEPPAELDDPTVIDVTPVEVP